MIKVMLMIAVIVALVEFITGKHYRRSDLSKSVDELNKEGKR